MTLKLVFLFFSLHFQFYTTEQSNTLVTQGKNGKYEYLVRRNTNGLHGNSSRSVLVPAAIVTELATTKVILKGILRIVQLEVKQRHNDSTRVNDRVKMLAKKLDDLENWMKSDMEDQKNKLENELAPLKSEVERLSAAVSGSISHVTPNLLQSPQAGEKKIWSEDSFILLKGKDFADCASVYEAGYNTSGVYVLTLDISDNDTQVEAYCDMDTEGGGWTVIQRRESGTDDFFRNWENYKEGFGDLHHDFWLGLKYAHLLTKNGNNRMRIDLWDWENRTRYAEYDFVKIKDETDNFRIIAGGYNGNAGDPFNSKIYQRRMQSMQFSTFDKDNDLNAHASCARAYSSGWWFNNCFQVNLNGVWYPSGSYFGAVANGIVWDLWTDHKKGYSLKKTEIKFRPEHL